MSFIGKIIGVILGRNGFDQDEHDAEVQELQQQAKECNDETQLQLGRAGSVFEGLDLDAAATYEEPTEQEVPPDR